MKHLLITFAFLTAICTAAFAGERPTKAENENAIAQGRIELKAKIQEMDNSIKNNNIQAAEAASKEVYTIMRKGMAQTMAAISLASADQQKAINARYSALEHEAHEYNKLSTNVSANGKKLLEYAKSYTKQY